MRLRLTTDPILGRTRKEQVMWSTDIGVSYRWFLVTYRLSLLPFLAFEWQRERGVSGERSLRR